MDAGTLDQRHRQSRLRLSGGGRGQRLYLVGQQPREPAHAVVERSGDRSPGRGFYLRDEDSGEFWTPDGAAHPRRGRRPMSPAMAGDTAASSMPRTASTPNCCSSLPIDAPIKISRLALHNRSGRPGGSRVTAYVEWVLGPSRADLASFRRRPTSTARTGAMFARNPWNAAFGSRVAFVDMGGRQTDWTGDRREFIGRNGDACRARRACRTGNRSLAGSAPASIPAARCSTKVDLAPGERVEIVCFLGEAASADAAAA